MTSMRRPFLLLLTCTAGLLGLALLVGILQLAEAPQSRLRVDLSSQTGDSLSERAMQALSALPQGSRLTAFLFREEQRFMTQGATVYPTAYGRIRTLLEDARIAAKGTLQVEVLDQVTPLVAIQNARERLNRQQGDFLFLETPAARRMIRFEEAFLTTEPTEQGAPARLIQERLDSALGDAALSLLANSDPKVGLLLSSEQDTITHATLAPFAQLLRDEGFEPIELRDSAWPEDLAILCVPGQLSALLPSVSERVRDWIDRGRPTFLGLGFGSHSGSISFWNELLHPRGIVFESGLVCAPWRSIIGSPECGRLEIPPANLSGSHPVSRLLAVAGRSLLLPGARPLKLIPAEPRFTRERLLWSTHRSWVDLDQDFEPGPLEPSGISGLSVASEPLFVANEEHNGRLFAIGSAHAFRGQELAFQREFFASAMRWLNGSSNDLDGLRAVHDRPFRLTASFRDSLLLMIAFLPSLAILFALLVSWRRRS